MKVSKNFIVCMMITLFIATPMLFAQQNSGGRGLFYVNSARTIGKGHLNSYFHTSFFGKVSSSEITQTIWNVQGSFTLNYGLTNRIELSLFPIIYQDVNRGTTSDGKTNTSNTPGDIFLKLKVGSLGNPKSKLKYGAMLTSRFPIGKSHNVIYEPYSAGTVELGLTAMASYAGDYLFPDESLNGHVNLGYIFHNDAGKFGNKNISSEVTYGIGVQYPLDKWDVTMELNGNYFVQKPSASAYSRENYLFITPGVSYRIYKWLHLDFGSDFRLTADNEESNYVNPLSDNLPSNYPDWRVHMAIKLAILPSSLYRESERDILVKKAETRREVFEQIVRERRETEKAEQELERIKEERMKAEQELNRLRELLDGKSSKTKKAADDKKKKKKGDG